MIVKEYKDFYFLEIIRELISLKEKKAKEQRFSQDVQNLLKTKGYKENEINTLEKYILYFLDVDVVSELVPFRNGYSKRVKNLIKKIPGIEQDSIFSLIVTDEDISKYLDWKIRFEALDGTGRDRTNEEKKKAKTKVKNKAKKKAKKKELESIAKARLKAEEDWTKADTVLAIIKNIIKRKSSLQEAA